MVSRVYGFELLVQPTGYMVSKERSAWFQEYEPTRDIVSRVHSFFLLPDR